MKLEELESTQSLKLDARSVSAQHDPSLSTTVLANRRFRLFSIDEVLSEPSPQWRVEGLLPVGAMTMLYAPQEQYKTFFALDLALCVAGDTYFHGRRVKAGPTVYILGEGRGGLKNRIAAWLLEHGVQTVDGAFFVLEAVQFKRPDDVKTLKAQIEALNVRPAMLVIDTFARNAVGIDENDASEVGLWIDAVTALRQTIDVDVVTIHHAQKAPNDDKKGTSVRERGSSAFIGAVDTVIRLMKDKTRVKVSCDKQKDAEHFAPFTLGVKVVPLGINEHGESASSLVLVDPEDPEAAANRLSKDLVLLLATLRAFPDGVAKRKDWWASTRFADRTFDRHRNELLTGRFIESPERGVFKITEVGLAAIASESPMSSPYGKTQDAAATHPPPTGGGVATGMATNQDEGRTDAE